MKKILLVTFALMIFATWSFALFAPTPMEITVPDQVTYLFDGTSVDITVDVSGKPAKCWLIINTRLPENQLPHQVKNGYLGWHYVNKIDTTVYVSGAYNFPVSTGNTITWDGKNSENTCGGYGGTYASFDPVASGTYDYYVWAYDDQSPRENVCNFLAISFYWQPQYTTMNEFDVAGMPLATPNLWGSVCYMFDNLHRGALYEEDADGNSVFVEWLDEPAEGENSYGPPRWTAFKFPLGSDPDDMSKLQTTFMPGFSEEAQLDNSPIVFDPGDFNYFYNLHVYTEQKQGAMFKWKWVGEGNAEIVDGWGGWDDLLLTLASRRGMGEYMPAVVTDNENIYISSPGRNPYEIQHDVFYAISFEGELLGEQMLDDVYFPDNPNETSTNGMINRAFASQDVPYQMILGGEQTCVTELIGCDRIIAGEGDDEYVKWINQNGDYFHDSAWDPTLSEFHWNCSSGAYRNVNGALRDEMFWDRYGLFTMFPMYQGLNSILIYTHDGSGVSYAKFADDTVGSDKNKKGSGLRIDTGSMYDGIYMGDVVSDDAGYGANTQHIHWVAFDSGHGVISTGGEGVEEEGQAAYSVDAAYPNPANPTTTIGFTIAEAGYVTVDIYNVAGQKVDTLVNSEMTSGKHSVVWDGSGFSAGVYFYTVKSGDFSKTMKVTLLK